MLFQEANILLLPENMIFFLLFKRERRLLSHLCQICHALLKIQQFLKYHAISGGKYSTVPENMNLFLFLEKGFCPIYISISCYFRRQISYCFQKLWTYFYYKKEKEGFCPIYVRFVLLYWKYNSFENITLFQGANILLLIENMDLFLLLLLFYSTDPPTRCLREWHRQWTWSNRSTLISNWASLLEFSLLQFFWLDWSSI